MIRTGFYRFEYGVQVACVTELHELLAQMRKVQLARHVDDHLHGEHQRAGVRRRVGARGDFSDIDAPGRAEPGQGRDDAGLIEAHGVDGVGQQLRACRAWLRPVHVQREAGVGGEASEFRLEFGERVPVARHEQHHRELVAEARHAALADVAAAVADDAGQFVNEPRTVGPDGRYGNVLFHP